MRSATDWIESLSPWPTDGFGLGRIRALLRELGDPQRAYPSIHVVGTNGKSTATRTIAALLGVESLRIGAYTSPHVSSWGERIQVGGRDADFEAALARVRPAAEALGATQFEAVTAAALAEFAAAEVDVAVVEAGLGGRHDATNVLDAPVVLLTNVSLEHTDVLGDTREAIAREKLAVAGPDATVVLGELEWARLVRENTTIAGGAAEAAAAFLGRPVDGHAEISLPGRLEWRSEHELWDGAHNLAGIEWLLEQLPDGRYVVVCSILADKEPERMLQALSRLGDTLVATRSSSGRALEAADLAGLAKASFPGVEIVPDPAAALARARELSGATATLLVTGSLYLLADLYKEERVPWRTSATG